MGHTVEGTGREAEPSSPVSVHQVEDDVVCGGGDHDHHAARERL